MLILEIKTRLVDLGALERQVGWYERLARQSALGIGWRTRRVQTIVLVLASDEVDRVVRDHRDLLALAFPVRARAIARGLVDPTTMKIGRGLAMIDPSSRRSEWLIRTRVDGRRTSLPYSTYADAVRG